LAWTWHDPQGKYHNLFAGGPVIDQDKNFYQTTFKGIYAINSAGQEIWHYEPSNRSNNEVTLAGDLVLGTSINGHAFAVNRLSGKEVWVSKLAETAGGDCGYPGASNGVFVAAADMPPPPSGGGNLRVFGLDVKNGTKMWEYDPDMPVWNFSPLFPGDGTVVFMDFAGGMYRLNLMTGAQIWRTLPADTRDTFSDGGAGLGPNQMAYSCSNLELGSEGSGGVARAFHLSNGSMAWEKKFPMPCNSYPSVGHLEGVEPLAVVVTPGSFMGQENLHGEVLALDATTGATIWSHEVKPYSGPFGQAAGDAEGFPTRAVEKIQPVCLPAHWSSPLIDGKGMVIAGRSDGSMYKLYGPQSSFKGSISNMSVNNGTVAEIIPLGSAFLHGALAAAPGIFAISSCDTLYVFKK